MVNMFGWCGLRVLSISTYLSHRCLGKGVCCRGNTKQRLGTSYGAGMWGDYQWWRKNHEWVTRKDWGRLACKDSGSVFEVSLGHGDTYVCLRLTPPPPPTQYSLSFRSVPLTSNLPLCNLSIALLSHHFSSSTSVKQGSIVRPCCQSPVLHLLTQSGVSMQQQHCCAFLAHKGLISHLVTEERCSAFTVIEHRLLCKDDLENLRHVGSIFPQRDAPMFLQDC